MTMIQVHHRSGEELKNFPPVQFLIDGSRSSVDIPNQGLWLSSADWWTISVPSSPNSRWLYIFLSSTLMKYEMKQGECVASLPATNDQYLIDLTDAGSYGAHSDVHSEIVTAGIIKKKRKKIMK